jgi:hypothetical protein
MYDLTDYPIPPGFQAVGSISTSFKHFKDITTYSTGGWYGYSKRWKNSKLKKTNMVAGFEFKIGPDAARRWKEDPLTGLPATYQDRTEGGVFLKFPRCKHNSRDRGVYLLSLTWFADRRNSVGRAGKEFPHPTTIGASFNIHNPEPVIGDIKDGNWHGFLAAVYNDVYTGAPTMKLWYNHGATGHMKDYIELGSSEDTAEKKMEPGPILPWSIEWTGHKLLKVEHDIEIRINDIPPKQLGIRNMFATEVIVEPNMPRTRTDPAYACRMQASTLREARIQFDRLEDKLRELQFRYTRLDTSSYEKQQILAEMSRLRSELPSRMNNLGSALKAYNDCKRSNPTIPPRREVPTRGATEFVRTRVTRDSRAPSRTSSYFEREVCS